MTRICLPLLTIIPYLLHFNILHSQVNSGITIHRDPVKMKRLAKFKLDILDKIANMEDKHVGLTIQNIVHKFKR